MRKQDEEIEGEESGRLMANGTQRGIKFLRQLCREGCEAPWDLVGMGVWGEDESADQRCCK